MIIKFFLVFAIVINTLWLITPSAIAAANVQWRYGGSENPTQWGKLSEDFVLCELGKAQSPINISNAIAGKPENIGFDYQPSPLVVINNGHTIQVKYEKGSKVTIDGKKYELLQFHFHTPSEHYINGQASPMELHLVHQNALGQLAVVGMMIKQGALNPVISEVWKHIPDVGETSEVADRLINAADLLPEQKSYFSYDGSLTTPPCSEGVKWNIFVEPIAISKEQIEAFEQIYQVDARPVQAINNRVVELHR